MTTIKPLDSVLDVLTELRTDTPKNPFGTDAYRDQYEWVDYGDQDRAGIVP